MEVKALFMRREICPEGMCTGVRPQRADRLVSRAQVFVWVWNSFVVLVASFAKSQENLVGEAMRRRALGCCCLVGGEPCWVQGWAGRDRLVLAEALEWRICSGTLEVSGKCFPCALVLSGLCHLHTWSVVRGRSVPRVQTSHCSPGSRLALPLEQAG